MTKQITIPNEVIISKIYFIRGQKVMLDRDLAILYGVETKYLKRQVKRNIARFPKDFMFPLSKDEFKNWRCQIGASKNDLMGLRHMPYAFTEEGVSQLSTVLNSSRAIRVNIQIIRLFGKMRRMLLTHKDILLKLEQLEKDVNKNSKEIQMIFSVIRELLNPPQEPRRKIGYKIRKDDTA
jgi:hypothetical protein